MMQEDFGGRSRFASEPTEITCAKCGQKDTVPFKPRPDSAVYCKACFAEMRGSRGPRRGGFER